jgi:hypothetical protein
LVANVVKVLSEFGYSVPRSIAPSRAANGNGTTPTDGETKWMQLLQGIRSGSPFHESITIAASWLIGSGMHAGAATHLLGAHIQLSDAPHDARWEARYRALPRAIDSAVKKFRKR